MAVAAQEAPKTLVDGTEEILTLMEHWEPGWSTLKFPFPKRSIPWERWITKTSLAGGRAPSGFE